MIKVYAAIGLVVAVALGGLYVKGLHSRLDFVELERDNAQASAKNLAEQVVNQKTEIARVNSLLLTLENKETEVRTVEKVITKEIVEYKDRVVNRCELSAEWVCIANAAARGVPGSCGTVKVSN